MKIFPLFAVIAGLTAGLALVPAAVATADITASAPPLVSQASADNACIALQEVTTGQSEVRKRIETRPLGRNNWHLDFLVPQEPTFSYFVAIVTPENTGPYWIDLHLRLPQGGSEKVFSDQAGVRAGTTYTIPFQSPTGRQPAVVNSRIGGVNGNYYTIAMAACR